MVNPKVTDLPASAIRRTAGKYPTPFFLYSEKKIRANCRCLKNTFRAYFPTFEPLYAVKANSNPHLLKIILRRCGLLLALTAYKGSNAGKYA